MKEKRAAYITRRADQLAATGRYANWREIEAAIRAEGYPEARTQLDNPHSRKILNEICAMSKGQVPTA